MKIVDAKVIVTCPGRNFVTLKIMTDQGIHGVGDATLNGRELAVASYLRDHVVPLLIGRDAHQIEDTWHYLAKGAYWRRGPVTMASVGAVDTALWDIKAKAAGLPLYQLLGGKSRAGVMVYGHANGRDLAETIDAVGQYSNGLSGGARAVRCAGLDSVTALRAESSTTSRRSRASPKSSSGRRKNISTSRRKLFEAVAAKYGFGVPPPARCAPPADADRGGAARQEPRALSALLAGGPAPAETRSR